MSTSGKFNCQKSFQINVTQGTLPCSAWTTATPLPDVFEQFPYSQQVVYSASVPNLTYSVTAGSLPDGLSCSSAGYITGTPTVVGIFTFTITATDGACVTCSKEFTIEVRAQAIDCGWVQEVDNPGVSDVDFACFADIGAIWINTTATTETPGACPGDSPTIAGYCSYYKDFEFTTEKQIFLDMYGFVNPVTGESCGTPIVADAEVAVTQTNLSGVPPILLNIDYTGDMSKNGVQVTYTGIIPANVICRITVSTGIINSIIGGTAVVRLGYIITDSIVP